MAIAYRGTAESANVAAGNPPATISGQVNGDVIIGVCFCQSAITAATGWTTLDLRTDGNTGNSQYIAWKKVTGTNDSFNPTYTGTSVLMETYSFSGADPTTPVEQFGITQWAGTSATVFPPSSTPTNNGAFHTVIYGEASSGQAVVSPPAGYTTVVTNIAGGARTWIGQKNLGSSSGGTPTGAINLVWAGVAYGPAVSIVINAGAGAGPYTLTAAQGSYALTGNDTGLIYTHFTYTLQAAQGNYLITGSDALVDTSMNADQGNYTLTGQATNLLFNKLSPFVQGQYSLTGFNVGLIYSGAPLVGGGNSSRLKMGLTRMAMRLG